MSNEYYVVTGAPATSSQGASATIRSEYTAIATAFDKLPTLAGNGNKAVVVNSGGTALSVTAAALALAVAFTTAGSGGITLNSSGATNVTLPTAGTLATLAGTEELTGKTLTSAVGKGTWTASGTWTLPAITLGGTLTMGANTLALASATVSGAPTWSSNQAITLSTAAQPAVTSLGTLTSLTMGGALTMGANTLALASATVSGQPTWSSTQAMSISGSSASTTGNAATATALQTARTINGVSFDGTGNITIAVGITLGTEQATTSGASIDFTGIPSGVKQIIVTLVGVSVSTTTQLILQIGDSGGVETTGYTFGVYTPTTPLILTDGGATAAHWRLTGSGSGNAADAYSGQLVLSLENATTNTWSLQGSLASSNAASRIDFCMGTKATSAVLDRVRLSMVTPGTFDAGVVNIQYQS